METHKVPVMINRISLQLISKLPVSKWDNFLIPFLVFQRCLSVWVTHYNYYLTLSMYGIFCHSRRGLAFSLPNPDLMAKTIHYRRKWPTQAILINFSNPTRSEVTKAVAEDRTLIGYLWERKSQVCHWHISRCYCTARSIWLENWTSISTKACRPQWPFPLSIGHCIANTKVEALNMLCIC